MRAQTQISSCGVSGATLALDVAAPSLQTKKRGRHLSVEAQRISTRSVALARALGTPASAGDSDLRLVEDLSGANYGRGCKRHRRSDGGVSGAELGVAAASRAGYESHEDNSSARSGSDGLPQRADKAPTSQLGSAAVEDVGSGANAVVPRLGRGSTEAGGGDCALGGRRVEGPKVALAGRDSGKASPEKDAVGKRARNEPAEEEALQEAAKRWCCLS